jgi:Tol biopolymer transport system component
VKRLALVALLLAACSGGDDEAPLAPAANGDIVFASKRDGDFDIYAMPPKGGAARNLTRDSASEQSEADDDAPSVSPDGTKIVFTSTRDHRGDGDESRDVYVMNVDGGDVRRLTENNAAERNPTWLRDGRIVFWRCSGGVFGCSLIAISAETEEEKTLFRAGDGVSGLSASPDGERVAFNRWDPEDESFDVEVVIAELDGDNERALTETPAIDGDAEWAPDGTKLVFTSDRDRNGKCLFHDCFGYAPELYVMNADGSDQRRLTHTPAYDVFPAWSPDGTKIVFARIADDEDDYELFLIDADGGEPESLTDSADWDWMPDWAPAR